MDVLLLSFRGEPLREFPLEERPLELGRGVGCDIVVHDREVADRHWLLAREGGAVVRHDLASGHVRPVRTGEELPLGRHHALTRLRDATPAAPSRQLGTEPLRPRAGGGPELGVVLGEDDEARRVGIGRRPLLVGSGAEADVRVPDRAVSKRHCRIEPSRGGVFLRDLGSRNGTSVDGVSVRVAEIFAGSRIRLGRTTLQVVARGLPGDARSDGLIAASAPMRQVLATVERLAALPWPALVTGESGVGKEGVARALHARGPRQRGPFVAINAGGMPASLVESELFGHEKGAFTGATAGRRGVFEQAHGGTLFLDEIGELPLELQARLLRVLESWEVRRLGSESAQRVDVRLVCATHRDLVEMVTAGRFRQDLFYRVAQLAVHVPPLRERRADIEPLAAHFLSEVADQLGPRALSDDALRRLRTHRWPGNVRELRNVCRQAAALSASRWIQAGDVEVVLRRLGVPSRVPRGELRLLVEAHDGNLTAAARALGIPRTTLRDRLRREAKAS